MTYTSLFMIVAGALVLAQEAPPRPAHAQNLQTAEQALGLILRTANDICQAAPLEQTSRGANLSGEANAKVGGLVGKLADLGISGAAQYQSGESRGVLQKDLIAAIQNSNDCKLQVFKTLQAKLLTSPTQQPVSPAATVWCTVADPTGTPLNVRDGPNGTILGSLPNGYRVEVARSAVQSGTRWIEIANAGAGPPIGWIYRPHIECPGD